MHSSFENPRQSFGETENYPVSLLMHDWNWNATSLTFLCRQVQGASGGSATYHGVWKSLVRMWKEEGVRGYMRGNGVNCLRIVPYVLAL